MEIEKCTGCGACINICPTNALEWKIDEKGFQQPAIILDKCIDCKKCDEVCPISNRKESNDYKFGQKVYAAWSMEDEVRLNSTSGGIFTELATEIISSGGMIVGALYDEMFSVVYHAIETKEGIKKLRQSKYVEASSVDEFQQIRQALDNGCKVLVVGTPCKIAGIKAFIGEDVENLYTCDFICRGSNSPKAYRSYLDELEKKYHSKIEKVWFKNKQDGWNRFGTKVEFSNGDVYFADRIADWYMRGYLKHNLFLRDSCTDCQFKNPNRQADITLADFWGIQIPSEVTDIEKGISMVSINSTKGEVLWKQISNKVGFIESDKETAVAKNWCADNSVQHGIYRNFFFEELEKGRDFSEIVAEIEKRSLK